jgi:hypothetical protein
MDAWTDEGRVYLVNDEPLAKLGLIHEDDTTPQRAELDGKKVLIDAISVLLERSRFEAATALYSCQLDLDVADAPARDDAPVWVILRAPAELVYTLENLERDVAWFVREAISEALPNGYQASEFVVQALFASTTYGDEGLAAA